MMYFTSGFSLVAQALFQLRQVRLFIICLFDSGCRADGFIQVASYIYLFISSHIGTSVPWFGECFHVGSTSFLLDVMLFGKGMHHARRQAPTPASRFEDVEGCGSKQLMVRRMSKACVTNAIWQDTGRSHIAKKMVLTIRGLGDQHVLSWGWEVCVLFIMTR